MKSYSGKVKVIYIDPPYNTGSDGFVYNDKFNFSAEDLAKRLDVSPERAERILSMTRRGSASHAAWLTFMLPRLSFARDLLTDDGVIFISIDDNEEVNLNMICNEIFGEENLLGKITVIVKPEGRRYGTFAKCHEYCLVYAKDAELIDTNEINVEGASYRYQDRFGGFNLKGLRNRNVKAFNSTNRPNLRYPFYADVKHPDSNGFCPVTTNYTEGFVMVEATVYGKIPSHSICIPTVASSNYSPDFMYVVKKSDGSKELNIVIETKAYDKESHISPDEDTKISCAEEFFKAMTANGYTVHFRKQINSTGVKNIIDELVME